MANFRILFLFTFLNVAIMSDKTFGQGDTLIYIGDPLCSWCYGFAPELDNVRAAFPDVPFEMVMGGLRPGGRESISDLSSFLKEHWTEVYRKTKRPFNFGILKQGDVIYDTEYACRSVVVAGQLMPDKKYEYFQAVQNAFYQDNILPNDVDAYVQIAIKIGMDGRTFHEKFKKRQSKADTYSEIDLAAKMGVTSFPTLIAKRNGKLFIVAQGYTDSEIMIAKLRGREFGTTTTN
jgi:putative protein-disulfide isomerase